ncbi:MAG TPA: MarR family transcriptional regulator [Burkholderiaceae bacterium]
MAGPRGTGGAGLPVLFRLFNEIGIIDQLARNRFERVMPQAMSVAQFSVLNHFVRLGGERSLADLARSFQVSRAAMTKLARKLEESGLVRVRDNPGDGRGKLVSISARGARAHQEAVAALAPTFSELARAFSTDEINRLLPTLEKVRVWLDTHRT